MGLSHQAKRGRLYRQVQGPSRREGFHTDPRRGLLRHVLPRGETLELPHHPRKRRTLRLGGRVL